MRQQDITKRQGEIATLVARRYNTLLKRKATSGSRNLLRGRRSVLLQRITRLATSLVPSLMPRASYRGSRGNQTCVERKHTVSCHTLWRDTLKQLRINGRDTRDRSRILSCFLVLFYSPTSLMKILFLSLSLAFSFSPLLSRCKVK